ncbi:YDG/SRA domain-containing protein [Amycolatopsis mongoliensis]|uniref:YDG/SRA domain-containing protein n=1 Tax=Amycolatopsis mongoliensis TaxID=715475 RepID=A0A9Y2NG96_9PSEU|nr:YDG/SRA domain-containing protein [Amycolatopsis sp. 4-36]WIY04576.1 YDG/SRA domain-containing protein [Amycolatopsis sp. 4-36]
MSLADVDREHVLRAIDEFDDLGREGFLNKYGFAEARQYVVVHDGREYDSKALIGSAHGYATGEALRPSDFSDGVRTVGARLTELGFDFLDVTASSVKGVPIYGDIRSFPEGTTFASRAEVAASGVHRALQAGIVGTEKLGAESIVSSGGYEDDDDRGDELIYTGQGGRDGRGRQTADQTFTRGNAALRTSWLTGAPVRVVRGPDPKSPYAPDQGYRYDGLYKVEDTAMVRGQSGYLVCRFQMVKLSKIADVTFGVGEYLMAADPAHPGMSIGNAQPGRKPVTAQRIIRTTKVADDVKTLHDHTCQICGTRLSVGDGEGYSEGAHVKALGGLHRGPDFPSNVLCLCPNCHVQFDRGAIVIAADRSVLREDAPVGKLRELPGHRIEDEYLEYHRTVHSSVSLR